jgi:hypothetical protein
MKSPEIPVLPRVCIRRSARSIIALLLVLFFGVISNSTTRAGQLQAGVAKVDITDHDAGLVNDPLYVKALVLNDGNTQAVIITVDVVAIAEIGSIGSDYLAKVRARLQKDLNIEPAHVLINASHCHGKVCADVEDRTVKAVTLAAQKMVSVQVAAGSGYEDRIMENRRLHLKDGTEADVRHAYSLPADEEVAQIGPVDPEIGLLRLDRENGQPFAVVYNFACHPIQGVPNGGNTADMIGFASKVIEDNLGQGVIALFLQGCGGDINPVLYKDVSHPRDAEPLGNLLGLSAMRALTKMECTEGRGLKVIQEVLALPRASLAQRIASMQRERETLLQSLQGTSLNLKTFVPLIVKYKYSPDFPSYYSHRYLHEHRHGRDGLKRLDTENRRNMDAYIQNIYTMEQLTRLQINLRLLQKHQAQNQAAGKETIDVEVVGMRIGDFCLVSFPGELTVQVGLNIKQTSPHPFTFVAGYSNGYIYYAPTAQQLHNVGGAQEDSDCVLAPPWQKIYETKALEILRRL